MLQVINTFLLFLVTAFFEISGCYLTYLVVKKGGNIWLLGASLLVLAVFAYLLTLHPEASGRVYAAYGGVYILVALMWLNWVDKVKITSWDVGGVLISLLGVIVIISQPGVKS